MFFFSSELPSAGRKLEVVMDDTEVETSGAVHAGDRGERSQPRSFSRRIRSHSLSQTQFFSSNCAEEAGGESSRSVCSIRTLSSGSTCRSSTSFTAVRANNPDAVGEEKRRKRGTPAACRREAEPLAAPRPLIKTETRRTLSRRHQSERDSLFFH